ncbi:hypothetical protein STEG23_009353 [Scotinomys teguina]
MPASRKRQTVCYSLAFPCPLLHGVTQIFPSKLPTVVALSQAPTPTDIPGNPQATSTSEADQGPAHPSSEKLPPAADGNKYRDPQPDILKRSVFFQEHRFGKHYTEVLETQGYRTNQPCIVKMGSREMGLAHKNQIYAIEDTTQLLSRARQLLPQPPMVDFHRAMNHLDRQGQSCSQWKLLALYHS